jgi:hypothetical protein
MYCLDSNGKWDARDLAWSAGHEHACNPIKSVSLIGYNKRHSMMDICSAPSRAVDTKFMNHNEGDFFYIRP